MSLRSLSEEIFTDLYAIDSQALNACGGRAVNESFILPIDGDEEVTISDEHMTRERVIFGVDLDRETDSAIKTLAAMERRSKRNFHAVLMGRIARTWREQPEALRKLRLIRDDQCPT